MDGRPVIGVMPLMDFERESYWMLPGYFHGVEQAGGLPVMLPLSAEPALVDRALALCDGFLLTGGHDVDPALYGEEPLPGTDTCPERDAMEARLIAGALATERPLFGICRGIQMLNVALGGTLYQDIPTQLPSELEHHMSAPYDRAVHEVRLVPGTPLYDLLGRDVLPVNSYHHQGVARVAPGLEVMASAPDGLVEAVRVPEARFVWAVQWHPEFMPVNDPPSAALFHAFVQAASGT